jgi:hypothetical protein
MSHSRHRAEADPDRCSPASPLLPIPEPNF